MACSRKCFSVTVPTSAVNRPQQSLPHVGMEVCLELVPVDVLASDDQIVEAAFFLSLSQIFGHILEMMQYFFIHAAFGVAGIVSSKAVPAAAPGQSMEQGFAFLEFIEVQIKKAGAVAVQHNHPQARLRTQSQDQRFQMKAPIDKELRSGKLGRQIELAPDVPAAAGKHNLGAV